MLHKPITRRSALIAFANASGIAAIASLNGCSSNDSSGSATSNEAPSTQKQDPTSAADARANLAWGQNTVVYEAYPKSFLDTEGKVIPGLFACGTDSMGVLFNEKKAYTNYGGCAQGYAFVSGRDAGYFAAEQILAA